MKKILVIGCSGSGKSYFSTRLSKLINIPYYHLDNFFWNPDKTHVTRDELKQRIKEEVFSQDSYILDGLYTATLEFRIDYADTIFFLDMDLDLCRRSVIGRTGTKRGDLPWIETEEDTKELLEWMEKYPKEQRPWILKVIREHPDKTYIIFNERNQVDEYLKRIEKGGQ